MINSCLKIYYYFVLFMQELAELVHKVHLLCLLARGRIIDRACDDPLIQVISHKF